VCCSPSRPLRGGGVCKVCRFKESWCYRIQSIDIRRLLSGPSQAHARQVPMDAQIVHMQSQNADACLKIPCRASSCQYLVSETGSPNMSTPPSCLRNHTKLVVRHSAALCPCSSFGMHAASDPARFSSADFSRCTLVPNMTPFAECHR
jgi:hypothetical protein